MAKLGFNPGSQSLLVLTFHNTQTLVLHTDTSRSLGLTAASDLRRLLIGALGTGVGLELGRRSQCEVWVESHRSKDTGGHQMGRRGGPERGGQSWSMGVPSALPSRQLGSHLAPELLPGPLSSSAWSCYLPTLGQQPDVMKPLVPPQPPTPGGTTHAQAASGGHCLNTFTPPRPHCLGQGG